MIRAYDEMYLGDAMYALGSMLDYAVNSCDEDLSLFYARFLRSGIAEQMERCNPRYLGGMSGIELAALVAERTGEPLKDAEPLIDIGSSEYWTGWTLAYLQWYLGKSFKALQGAGIDVISLIERYPALHEGDLSKSVRFACRLIGEDNPGKRLKDQRKAAHLTQRELALHAGTSLRAIRSYEQSQVPISGASAESVLHLSRALSCRPEDLLG